MWNLFEFGVFFVQKSSCKCWWDRQWFSGRIYGWWKWRSGVPYLWVMPLYVSLLSCNAIDPVYVMVVEKMCQATEKLEDWYGHFILPGKLNLEGSVWNKDFLRGWLFLWKRARAWLYVLIMSCTRFRVNPHSIVAWMSRNSLLKIGAKSEV